MSKALELVVITILLVSAFFCGVAYSNKVKENFNWLFEIKEQEVEIPNRDDSLNKPFEIHQNPENKIDQIENKLPESIDLEEEINEQTNDIN